MVIPISPLPYVNCTVLMVHFMSFPFIMSSWIQSYISCQNPPSRLMMLDPSTTHIHDSPWSRQVTASAAAVARAANSHCGGSRCPPPSPGSQGTMKRKGRNWQNCPQNQGNLRLPDAIKYRCISIMAHKLNEATPSINGIATELLYT